MKRKTGYSRAPKEIEEAMASSEIVEDFLPSPEELLAREPAVKITLALGQTSVEFFKRVAKQNRVPYQAMIRKVIDLYALHHMHKSM